MMAFVVHIGCNTTLAAAAAALCAYIAPAAAGSGIPEVKAYLNGIDAHSILAPSTLLVKVMPSSCASYVILISMFRIRSDCAVTANADFWLGTRGVCRVCAG